MRFKQFEIRKPTLCGNPPTKDYYKYHFDLARWAEDNSHCWSIAALEWIKEDECFAFYSCGRYLKYREDGLEEWLLKWCELKAIEYKYEEE